MTRDDLAAFRAVVVPATQARFGPYALYGCGPWSQGPMILHAAQILSRFPLRDMGHNSARYIHTVAEALKLAAADREAYFGDSALVDVPLVEILGEAFTEAGGALYTGRNHHSVGMGSLANFDSGYPGYRGKIDPDVPTIAELLRPHGYRNYVVGKWHGTRLTETGPSGPFDGWPLARGFDRFYGFLDVETDQFSLELVRDNSHITPLGNYETGYHLTEDFFDEAIRFLKGHIAGGPSDPWFLMVNPGDCHAPHQAPVSCLFVSDRVHFVRCIQGEQPGLSDLHPALCNVFADGALLGQCRAESGAVLDPRAHDLECTLGHSKLHLSARWISI